MESIILCPDCKNLAHYNSHFQSFMCSGCNSMHHRDKIKLLNMKKEMTLDRAKKILKTTYFTSETKEEYEANLKLIDEALDYVIELAEMYEGLNK